MCEAIPPTDDPSFPDLTKRVTSGGCVAFIGAGMSRAHYPSWAELLERIRVACGIERIESDRDKQISLMKLAQLARESDRGAYFSELRAIFQPAEPTSQYHLIAKLEFDCYLTTNYDSLLIEACRIQKTDPKYSEYPLLRIEDRRPGEVFFLHGRVDCQDGVAEPNLVLAEDDYLHAYETSFLRSFLEQFLPFHSVCFFGCSLEDEYLQGVFRMCRRHHQTVLERGHPNEVKWFILLDRAASLPDGWEDIGLVVVRYDKIDGNFEGLRQILDYWAGIRPATRRRLAGDEIISYDARQEVPR